MNCTNCGYPLNQGEGQCPNCHTPVNQMMNQTPNQNNINNQVNMAASYVTPQPNVNNQATYQQPNVMNNNPGINQGLNNMQQSPLNTPTSGLNNNLNNPLMNKIDMLSSAQVNDVPEEPKKSKRELILVILAVLALIGGGIYFYTTGLFGGKKNDTSEVPTETTSTTYMVKYNGLNLSVPSDLVYEETNGNIVIADADATWNAYITVNNVTNDNQIDKDKIHALYVQNNYTIGNAEETELDGITFATLEASKDSVNALIAFAKVDNNVFKVVVYSNDGQFNHDALSKVASILSGVTVSSSANISTFDDISIDYNGIFQDANSGNNPEVSE